MNRNTEFFTGGINNQDSKQTSDFWIATTELCAIVIPFKYKKDCVIKDYVNLFSKIRMQKKSLHSRITNNYCRYDKKYLIKKVFERVEELEKRPWWKFWKLC